MLMVIFGAGASYDSIPEHLWSPRSAAAEYRPPLASTLFEERAHFIEALNRFSECHAIVGRLRRAATEGVLLEKTLEDLLIGSEDETRLRQLAAVQFYLQDTLWECSERWGALVGGTNYDELLDRLRIWARSRDEQVIIVTFNYDTLLEQACQPLLRRSFDSLDDYLADETFRIVKLHGSVNWAWVVRKRVGAGNTWLARKRAMIDEYPSFLKRGLISDDLRIIQDLQEVSIESGFTLFPALAVPVVSKNRFECPPAQLEELRRCIPLIDRLLIIGWKGAEEQFLSLWAGQAQPTARVHIVGGSDQDNRETNLRINNVGLGASEMLSEGFSEYLTTRESGFSGLDRFLR